MDANMNASMEVWQDNMDIDAQEPIADNRMVPFNFQKHGAQSRYSQDAIHNRISGDRAAPRTRDRAADTTSGAHRNHGLPRHPPDRGHLYIALPRGDHYRPHNSFRNRSPRAHCIHPDPLSCERPASPSYEPLLKSSETQLSRAMADLDVRHDDRGDRRDRGREGGGGHRNNNNRKRRYDGKLYTTTSRCFG